MIYINLKLLNSALKGCEFELALGTTLFIVANENILSEETRLPENAIFIPASNIIALHNNFELIVEEELVFVKTLFSSDENATTEPQPQALAFHQKHTIGELSFVMKRQNETWQALPVESHSNPQNLTTEISVNDNKEQKIETTHSNRLFNAKLLSTKKNYIFAGASLLTLLLIVLAPYVTKAQNHDAAINAELVIIRDVVLNSENSAYQAMVGKDKIIYLLAPASRWLKVKKNVSTLELATATKILRSEQEYEKINHWLTSEWPSLAHHKIDINFDAQLTIFYSKERGSKLTPVQKQTLLEQAQTQFPYTHNVKLIAVDDQDMIDAAQAGIDQISLPYRRQDSKNSVTFIIHGMLQDTQLQQLRTFIEAYQRTWGENYVQFSLALQDDWAKGQAYQYGDANYFKSTLNSWHFIRSVNTF